LRPESRAGVFYVSAFPFQLDPAPPCANARPGRCPPSV